MAVQDIDKIKADCGYRRSGCCGNCARMEHRAVSINDKAGSPYCLENMIFVNVKYVCDFHVRNEGGKV